MVALLCFVFAILASPLKTRTQLEAENTALRHQLIILCRQRHVRVRLTNNDRWFFIQLYRWFPSILKILTVVRPETLVRWHRAGVRSYWRWKSRSRGGRPQIETDLRALIRRMSIENLLWGAPRIHGELLKLGFEVAQSSVAKYMVKRRGTPSQGWRTFLRNHAPDVAAMDLFVVPTICRTADRINPARVPRPYRRLGRGASAPDPASLCRLIQQEQNTPFIGQRCPGVSPDSAGRYHHITPDPWRASSSLRSGLGFRYTHVFLAVGADGLPVVDTENDKTRLRSLSANVTRGFPDALRTQNPRSSRRPSSPRTGTGGRRKFNADSGDYSSCWRRLERSTF